MNNVHRNIMRFAAVLALTAATTSAFAQSAEYRRGYDDGFAAGQRAARNDGRSPARLRVRIDKAEYGARGGSCDPTFHVSKEIERTGGAVVSNEMCGDPAPGEPKRLRIVYRCGNSEPMRAVAREGETLHPRCGR
ncbi:MAG: hypothetical protein WCC39_06345 [Telluria sp.]